jgi:hypothetical protein
MMIERLWIYRNGDERNFRRNVAEAIKLHTNTLKPNLSSIAFASRFGKKSSYARRRKRRQNNLVKKAASYDKIYAIASKVLLNKNVQQHFG